MNNLFLSFYVLEALQKESPKHKSLLDSAVYKMMTCLTVIFFYVVMIILYSFRDAEGFNFKLRPYRGILIVSFLVVGFAIIRMVKKHYLKKHPEFIDPKAYSQSSIRSFKINVITLSVILILPALFLIYKALFEF